MTTTTPLPVQGRAFVWAMLLIALIGILGRIAYVDRPFDHRTLNSWREADYTQLTRNFYRGEMNPFYPQIDWRGDGPGFVEMELPVVPWIAAALDRGLGYREAMVRIPSVVASILALLLFMGLSRRLLPPAGALFAAATFAVNPLLIQMATGMQPESVMLLLSLLAMVLIWRWDAQPRRATLLAAAATIAAAILTKSPAAYLGLVLTYVVIRKQGWRAFGDLWNYIGAAIVLLPPLAWYAWTRQFWVQFGNSLGVSNESHFLGWDMVAPPTFLLGILRLEHVNVFTPAGWLLAALGLAALPTAARGVIVWCVCLGILYIAAGRTTGDPWAYYYHASSVAPACLLMGAGVAALTSARWHSILSARIQLWLAVLLMVSTLLFSAYVGSKRVISRDSNQGLREMHRCVLQFQPLVPPGGKIVVRGGSSVDESGMPVAYNESMAFAWIDRQGFNYPSNHLTLQALQAIAARGGRFWIAQPADLSDAALRGAAEGRFTRLATCGEGYALYDLGTR